MLPKKYRLAKDKDFKNVFKRGRTAKIGFLILRWFKNSQKTSRFGFVISNKISNKSIIRHRIKRWLSESVRAGLGKIQNGYDCVFLTLPDIKNKDYQQIQTTVKDLLKRANLTI